MRVGGYHTANDIVLTKISPDLDFDDLDVTVVVGRTISPVIEGRSGYPLRCRAARDAAWDQPERSDAINRNRRSQSPATPPTTNIRACVTELSQEVKLKLIAKQNKTFF